MKLAPLPTTDRPTRYRPTYNPDVPGMAAYGYLKEEQLFTLAIQGEPVGGKNEMRVDPRDGHHHPKRGGKFEPWRTLFLEQNPIPNPHNPYRDPVRVLIRYWTSPHHRGQKPDATGVGDAVMHVLEGCWLRSKGVKGLWILNDGQVYGLEVYYLGKSEEPRVECEIWAWAPY